MRKIIITKYALLASCFFALNSFGQSHTGNIVKKFGKQPFEKCGSTQYEALLRKKNPNRATVEQFEQWLAPKTQAARLKRLQKMDNVPGTDVVTIPVVVHVIHSGVAIGENENITNEQILSQLTVLNQDFRKMVNTNGYNTNPVGADTKIEFCLAQQDEYGVASTGIIRRAIGPAEPWNIEDIEVMKTQTHWDPEKYLNIWVVNEMFGVAGYAQFPEASGLDGLEGGSISEGPGTDGVVIAYNCFGSQEVYPQGIYLEGHNLGRTATHEIGHFFGLRHIWGDDFNCTADDYCADTPIAFGPNQGCPAGLDSCPDTPGNDMIENYMDYTDNSCQNIFTLDQMDRMVAVLQNSPRRMSLLTSNVCTAGVTYENDGALNINIDTDECSDAIMPEITLTNTGSNTITSAVISYFIDDNTPVTYNWTGSLAPGEEDTFEVTESEIALAAGLHTFSTSIVSVNNTTDELPANDTKTTEFNVNSVQATTQIIVTVKTDDYGDETVWVLLDSNEEPVLTNAEDINADFPVSTYGNNQVYTHTYDVTESGCYSFVIIDFGQDGICCEYGEGYYTVTTANGTILANGGDFDFVDQKQFGISSTLSNNNTHNITGIKLYPNPANTILTVTMPQAQGIYTVYNSIGQVISHDKAKTSGFNLDVSGYNNGIYFIKIETAAGSETLRFIKN